MNIGIYKPTKKILFDDKEDTSSWSLELVNLAKIFAEHGHQVYILSETDYKNNIKNIFNSPSEIPDKFFDIIFLSNGKMDSKIYTENKLVEFLNSKCYDLILLETDLTLSLDNHTLSKYKLIFSQSKHRGIYAHLEKLCLYKHKLYKNNFKQRTKSGIFIGHERDRKNKIFEYVVRPNMKWFGKSLSLNLNTKIGKNDVDKSLSKYLYTIVISGDIQNAMCFVSQRYFENCAAGIINFVDYEYDRDELIIKRDDWRRVKNYEEFFNKAQQLCKDKQLFDKLQREQFDEIKLYLDGEFIYQLFMENLK